MVEIPNAPRMGDMPKGEPVPEAVYHIRCDKTSFKRSGSGSKHPGTPMAEAQFTIFGPEEAEEFHGRKLFENFMLDGEGMFRTRQFLESCPGIDEDFVLSDTDQLLNLECAAVVEIEPERRDQETGKVYPARNRIKRFFAIE